MPVIQDGNAYKYYVSSPSHYIKGSSYIDVTQDVEQSTGDDLPMSLDLHAKKKSINYYYSNITT